MNVHIREADDFLLTAEIELLKHPCAAGDEAALRVVGKEMHVRQVPEQCLELLRPAHPGEKSRLEFLTRGNLRLRGAVRSFR